MLRKPGWTMIRTAPGEPPRAAWLAALIEPGWRDRAQVLKQEGDDWVAAARLRIASNDREVIVKYRRARGPAEAVKTLLNAGRLTRQWRGGLWLAARNIPTARPLALVQRINLSGAEEVLVMDRLTGRTLLDHLAHRTLPPPHQRTLAREVGAAAARLAAAGRFNRDHKPSNLIVTRTADDSAEIAVIDAVAIRPTTAPLRGLDRMLASLVLEPLGCRCPPTPWEMRSAVRAAAAELATRDPAMRSRHAAAVGALTWALWTAAADIVESHGDPTPRVSPLPPRSSAPPPPAPG